MYPLGVTASEFVAEMGQAFWHATPAIQSIDPKGHQLVLPLLSQALNDVDILTWKVLMNEKNPHESETLKRFRLVLKFSQQKLQVGHLPQLMFAVRLMPTCRGKVEAIKQSSSFDAERSLQLRNNRSASHRSHAMNQK